MIEDNKKFYFIAGLHRSGSTLLSAILNQNPRFYSGPISPVINLIKNLESSLQESEFYESYPKPQQAHDILSSLIHQYHSDIDRPVVFEKNRIWPRNVNYIEGYIKEDAKIICPVRSVDEILVSFLKLIHKNQNGQLFNPIDKDVIVNDLPLTDYNRCRIMLNPKGNILSSINAMKYAIDNDLSNRLIFVEYNDLVLSPQETFERIYGFLGEDYYQHQFDHIQNKNEVKDEECFNLKGLHDVREKLEITSDNPTDYLEDDVIEECNQLNFWRS
jgi:sulfotransferase